MSKKGSEREEKGKITIIRHKKTEKSQDRSSKIDQSSNSEEKVTLEPLSETTEAKPMTNILDDDERLLFSLKIVGDLQKNEKLMEKNGLPSVDDRYFQAITRWYSGDSRHKTSDMIHQLAKDTRQRVQKLLDEDFEDRLNDLQNREMNLRLKETPEQKRYREQCDDRRRTITSFFENLSKAKQGVENLKDTYNDKYIKGRLALALANIDETLEKLRKIQ